LVGHWQLDGNANDSTKNGYDGTVNGATWVSGVRGNALSFDGIDDYVNVGHHDLLDPASTQQLTIAAWVKIPSYQALNSSILFGIVGKANSPFRDNGSYVFGIVNSNVASDQGKLRFGVCYDGLHWQDVYSTSVVPLDKWVNVAVTHDALNTTSIYVNGILDSSSNAITQDFQINADQPFRIGHTNSYSDYFYGQMNDVRFYNQALGAADVAALTPEPSTFVVLGGAAVGLFGYGWRRRKTAKGN
jgi:hypothetical protein